MRVEYTAQFEEALDNMFTCNRKYYSKSILSNVFNSLRKFRNLLTENPLMGQEEPLLVNLSVEYRYVILHKYLKLVYFVLDDVIYFADVWDVRQSPDSIRKRIID